MTEATTTQSTVSNTMVFLSLFIITVIVFGIINMTVVSAAEVNNKNMIININFWKLSYLTLFENNINIVDNINMVDCDYFTKRIYGYCGDT